MKPAVLLLNLVFAGGLAGAETVRVQGSGTMAKVFSLAAPVVRAEFGFELKIRVDGTTTTAIHSAAAGAVDVAMATRPLTAGDRSDFPERALSEVLIGHQALAFVVSRDVWESGVRSLTKAQALAIYEGGTKNWKALGGADLAIKFYNPARGHGVWEMFAGWLYGEVRKAPLGQKFESVPGGREARDAVAFAAGSFSVAAPRWADEKTVFALAIKDEQGAVLEPTPENIQAHRYPLARALYLVAGDRPTGNVKKLFNFILSPRGQEIVKEAEFTAAKDPKPLE